MKVVGIGSPVLDYILKLDRMPRGDEFLEVRDSSCQGGGRTATALAALAKLGVETALIGHVGNDLFGRYVMKELEMLGVNTEHMVVDEADTNMGIPLVDLTSGKRAILRKRGNTKPIAFEDVERSFVTKADILHVADMGEVCRTAAGWMKEVGKTVVIDADDFDYEIEENLDKIDIFIASETYYKGVFHDEKYEENCRATFQRGPKVVIYTLGNRGCVGYDGKEYFELPIFKVPVVDTTCAGDVFHGGYIFGMTQGWSAKESARFASAVSAIKCTAMGGHAGLPELEMARRFMEEGKIDRTPIEKMEAYYRRGFSNVF